MYNNSRIAFIFEKSESDNTLLFTVVQAIFLLIDASLESGVPKRVAECSANVWMHSLMEHTLSSNKPNNAVRTIQTFNNKSWTTTGQLKSQGQQTTQRCN